MLSNIEKVEIIREQMRKIENEKKAKTDRIMAKKMEAEHKSFTEHQKIN